MIAVVLVALALVLPSESSYLQYFETQSTSHFRASSRKVGVSNVPDLVSRPLHMGVFVKAYVLPPFLNLKDKSPRGNLFVAIPNYNGAPLKGAKTTFEVVGHAKVSEILAGTNAPDGTSSSLADLTSAHFSRKVVCASHCPNLAASMCGNQKDLVAPIPKSKKVDAHFVERYQISSEMPPEFVNEMTFLSTVSKSDTAAIFFGVSSFGKVPEKLQADARRLLESVIMDVLKQLPSNSVAEVLTMGSAGAFHHNGETVHAGQASGRRLLATPTPLTYLPGDFLAQVWVSVGGFFVIIAVAYYLAFMDYTQDSVLYTTMNPNLADRRR